MKKIETIKVKTEFDGDRIIYKVGKGEYNNIELKSEMEGFLINKINEIIDRLNSNSQK